MNKAIIDGQQQPVHNGAGGLVNSGVFPADVVSASKVARDSRGKFVAGGAGKSAAVGESDAGGAGAAGAVPVDWCGAVDRRRGCC